MVGTRTFRVFVSSTFRDFKLERDALQDKVFSELHAYCAEKGYGFQAVDLRWGIREEASAGHRTMRICLSEVARCQEISPRPNFVVLLGDRYGWRPLPEVVAAEEFERVKDLLDPDGLKAAERAYLLDNNAVPPAYVLRALPADDATYDANALRAALAEAAQRANLPDVQFDKYSLSATEHEIIKGVFQADRTHEHVFCFLRELGGLPDHVPPLAEDPTQWPCAANFRDFLADGHPDGEAAGLLHDLKCRLRHRLGHNLFEYQASWAGDSPGTGHIDALCSDMLASLRGIIDSEIERLSAYTHLERERATHDEFAREHARGFVGRKGYLDDISGYLSGSNGHPLCLYGDGGFGKSALLARAVIDAKSAHPNAVVVSRFIGVSSESADPRSLLQSLCNEIGEAYGSMDIVPSTLLELERDITKRLQLASSDSPLIVFLDGLDQLSAGNGAGPSWLPSDLPDCVHLVVTTRPGPWLDNLERRLPEALVVGVGRMPSDEAGVLLDSWLAGAGRTLQSWQRAGLLEAFDECGSPLYLRLAFEVARLWPSASREVRLGRDVPSVIADLCDRLEAEHGTQLVGHALGFLARTYDRLGLSEHELLEALTADEETWTEFAAGTEWDLSARKLPTIVWSRLYFDLAPYLSLRASEGTTLVTFFHKELADVAEERYGERPSRHLHDVLAGVMRTLASGELADGRDWKGSAHALAELPYHLARAGRSDDLFATLTDFTYLEAKARRVAVRGGWSGGYDGVLALLDDYDESLRLFQAAGCEASRSGFAPDEQCRALERFREVLDREAHILNGRPYLLWQQMYNRLQWFCKSGDNGLLADLLESEFEERSKPSSPLWLHSLVPLQESDALLRAIEGNGDWVNDLAYSPDGTHMVSCSHGEVPVVWDARTRACTALLQGHTGEVNAVDYSPDGLRIVSAGTDRTLRIWQADTGEQLRLLHGHRRGVTCCAFSPDGTQIVSVSADNEVKIWNVESGQVQTSLRAAGRVTRLATSVLARGIEGVIDRRVPRYWRHVARKELTETLLSPKCSFSPDGTRVVSASWGGGLRIWRAPQGRRPRLVWRGARGTTALVHSPDGTRLVSGGWDGMVRVWEADTGVHVSTLAGDPVTLRGALALLRSVATGSLAYTEKTSGGVRSLAYSPDLRLIAAGSWDRAVKTWNTATGVGTTLVGHHESASSVTFSADGTCIASGSMDGQILIWDTGVQFRSTASLGHSGAIFSVAYSPDGRLIASGSYDRTIGLWDAATGTPLLSLSGHAQFVKAVCFSPDGTRLVSGSWTNTPMVWDLKAGTAVAVLTGHTNGVGAAAYSPDGTLIATGSLDKTIRIWDASTGTGRAVLRGHTQEVNSLAFSPDGHRIVSGSGDGTVRVWEVATGTHLATFAGHSGWVQSVAFSPDGLRIASGSADWTVRIWEAATGVQLAGFTGHTHWVNRIAFSPDGSRIASTSEDRTLRLWDIGEGRCVALFAGSAPIFGCAFDPSRPRLSCGDGSGSLHTIEMVGSLPGDVEFLSVSLGERGAIGIPWATSPAEELRWLEQVEAAARQMQDPAWLRKVVVRKAGTLLELGRLNEAEAALREHEQMCREVDHAKGLRDRLSTRSRLALARGEAEEALGFALELERGCRADNDQRALATSLSVLGDVLQVLGRIAEAQPLYVEAVEISRAAGDTEGLREQLGLLGWIDRACGKRNEAAQCFQEQERISRETKSRHGLQASLGGQATLARDEGRLDEALRGFEEQECICRQLGDLRDLQASLNNQGLVYWDMGEFARAVALFAAVEQNCRSAGLVEVLWHALYNQAEVLFRYMDQYFAAREKISEAVDILRRTGIEPEWLRRCEDLKAEIG